jgi:hypothetical protein
MPSSCKLYLSLTILCLAIISCTKSPEERVKDQVTSTVKKTVKNPESYKSLHFSKLDTAVVESRIDSIIQSETKFKYEIVHVFEIKNSKEELIKMTVGFRLDSNFNIVATSPKAFNGDYGIVSGNVFWKYNNYVGNKPDAGSTVLLFALDTLRENVEYKAAADVKGDFTIENVLAGRYLMITKSKNTTSSPDDLLDMILLYGSDIREKFPKFPLADDNPDIKEYRKYDSLRHEALTNMEMGFSARYTVFEQIEKVKSEKARVIMDKLPKDVLYSLGVYGSYSNKIDISTIIVEEGKTHTEIIDFGITYY